MKKMHDKATKCMTKVNKAYDDSLERLKKEIDHISDGSSLTEKIDYDRYKELLQIYNTTKDKRVKAEAKRLIKENSASYRIQRKEALAKAIEIEKLKQVDTQLNLGGKHLKNVYSSVLNDLGGAKVSKKYLDEVLNHEWAGSNFSKRVWHNQDVLAKSLESNLLQSFASGKSNKQIADELEYHTNLGRYAANRLIRTETSYMVNSADLESSKQRGIKAKKFQANLDKRTSKICREHNQKVILIDDIKIGVNAPPLHPYCRSFLSDVLEGWDYETEEELQALVTNDDVDTEEVKYTTEQINNALENYVSGDGMWINSYLRNPTEFGNLTEDEKEYLSIMDYALKNDIKETTLYRSVDAKAVFGNITDIEFDDLKSQLIYGDDNKKALELINSVKGKEIVEKGFMSTTTEKRIALDWGDFSGSDKPIVLELKTPKGTKGKNLHFLDFEDDPQREVLLARNTKYKINSIETKEGQIYLKAEVIENKSNKLVKTIEEEAELYADYKLKHINKIEPEITKFLKDVSNSENSELFGLDYRIKTKESLIRKIISDSKEKGITAKETTNQINDILRYTMINDDESFTYKYFRIVEKMKEKGYNVIRVKNTFVDGVTYKGINTLVKSKSGDIFELQFHTPESIKVKENELHKLYEKQRLLDRNKDKKKWDSLTEEMIKISNTVPIPKNVERIK
nr:MAG TPA: minor capsid protein [Caudoviricetes sp.]